MKRVHYTPLVGDGPDNLGAFVESLDKWDLSMVYEEVHKVIGCGNFVVVLSLKLFAGRQNRRELGRHAKIPPKEQRVNTGSFERAYL
jgi:hypothetical protein